MIWLKQDTYLLKTIFRIPKKKEFFSGYVYW